jgi:hypothetical protein
MTVIEFYDFVVRGCSLLDLLNLTAPYEEPQWTGFNPGQYVERLVGQLCRQINATIIQYSDKGICNQNCVCIFCIS